MMYSGKPKIFIIGIDGGTFDLIEPWVNEGLLPNFARLMKEGYWGNLESTMPPITAPAWTSFMTGKNPGKHGLFHFIEPEPGRYEMRYTNALSRRAKTLWAILNEAGLSTGVFNVPMTYPPEKLNGYCISGLDAPEESSRIFYPESLYKELQKTFNRKKLGFLGVQFLGETRSDNKRDQFIKRSMEVEDFKTDMILHLMETHPTDVVMMVFRATDHFQHLFWHFMDPAHPRFDAVGAIKYNNAILKIYQNVDMNIQRILSSLSDDTSVVMLSDHGAGATPQRVFYVNRFLQEIGMLHLKGGNNRDAGLINYGVKKMDKVLRTFLPSDTKATLVNNFPTLRRKWEERSTLFSSIDWSKTRAYCHEVLTNPSNICINVKGKMPEGIVNPGKEYKEIIENIREQLYSLKEPRSNEQVIKKVYTKEELYNGPYLEEAPDLTLAWWEENSFVGRPSFGVTCKGSVDYVEDKISTGTEWSGTHKMNGVFLLKGPGFKKDTGKYNASIMDLTPTLLYRMGVPVPRDMDGRVLKEAFTDDFISSNPVKYSDNSGSQFEQQEVTYEDDEAEMVKARLRDLGYVQ
ncbi:MAG: alkaline phosphatase family protein [Nitrospirae bacterium]|nr:alkaline phosphatase family protein [Nitrospirota bacterium]